MTFKFSPIMLLIYWILLLELLQHDWKSSNVAFSVTGAIKGTSQLKIYKGLGFESVKFRRWFRCLCFLYKSRSTQTPTYLFNIIPSANCIYNTQNPDQIETCCRNILCLFKYSFFPYTVITAANKCWSVVNYCQSLALECLYLLCNDHCH